MSKQSELQCWEIIQCNKQDDCLLVENGRKACWEVVEADAACSFHICVDCLVYLAKQENSPLSHDDFCSILAMRKEKGIKQFECNIASYSPE